MSSTLNRKKTWNLIATATIVAIAIWYQLEANPPIFSEDIKFQDSAAILQQAFDNKTSNLQVVGQGRVTALLADDLKEDRHQRFILEFNSGQTVLVAHNIDLAPRIDSLKRGDQIEFNGEYEWNSKGGVIHWTHDDPDRKHQGGWLKHKGHIYK